MIQKALVLTLAIVLGSGITADAFDTNKRLIAAAKKTPASNDPVVLMETNKGVLKIQLFRKDLPITAGNFIDLVQKGFYNGLKFHRYLPGFIIQGGDPMGNGSGIYVDPVTHQERRIPLELKPTMQSHNLGTLSMARTGDPNSASCQFYICLGSQPKLDSQDAVFGMVIDGIPILNGLREGDKIVKAVVQEK